MIDEKVSLAFLLHQYDELHEALRTLRKRGLHVLLHRLNRGQFRLFGLMNI